MDNRITVLEGIIQDIGAILYQKWWNALPAEEQTQDKSEALAKNAGETAFWVIQEFMNRFNSEAEKLKTIDDPKQV